MEEYKGLSAGMKILLQKQRSLTGGGVHGSRKTRMAGHM